MITKAVYCHKIDIYYHRIMILSLNQYIITKPIYYHKINNMYSQISNNYQNHKITINVKKKLETCILSQNL